MLFGLNMNICEGLQTHYPVCTVLILNICIVRHAHYAVCIFIYRYVLPGDVKNSIGELMRTYD